MTGAAVRAMMPLSRAIYSNGFGRYPLVLFADDGIYAVPQTTAGSTLGEPRLLDRRVIAPGSRPVEGERFDVICSNPPYIAQEERPLLSEEVLCEPEMALFAPENGLQMYRRLADEAPGCLQPGGALLVEIGWKQKDDVSKLFAREGVMER